MKLKKEYVILGVVIVALVLYLALHKTNREQYQLPVLPEVAAKDINRIEIKQADEALVLSKKDNKWYIAPKDYPAETNTVDGMLDVLEELTLTALVSESKSYFRYELGEEKKIAVSAWAGEALSRRFDIGKAAPTYQHTFVLLAGDPNIYHAGGSFRYKFDKTADKLRDTTVLSLDKKQVQSIRLAKGDQSQTFTLSTMPVEITKSGDAPDKDPTPPAPKMEWMTPDNEPADQPAIDSLLTMLSRLKCDTYRQNENKDDFADSLYRVEISGVKPASLSILAKDDTADNKYPAVSSDSDYPFYLSESQGKSILEKIDNLLAPPEGD